MNVVVVDDEKPAISVLKQYIGKVPFLNIKLATTNPFEVLDIMSEDRIDLLFTDIEMPDLSGVALARSLEYKPMLIFTTAYENYALEGFELDAVDYLVKPIRFERFLKAVNKANKLFKLNQQFTEKPAAAALTIKVEYKTLKIPFESILYIEGLKDYVKIYTDQQMYLTRLNLKGITTKLPGQDFIRIHRSYIVSLAKIESFQKSQLLVAGKELPIGNSYRELLLKKLG